MGVSQRRDVVPLFGQGKDPAEEEAARARQQLADEASQSTQQAVDDATRARFDWALAAPPAELATQLMAALGPDRYQNGLTETSLRSWLGFWEARYRALDHPIDEALQLLEHSELVCVRQISDSGARYWRPTRLGLTTLAQGRDAVRQRIKDRTGL
jgi:hypothetical protein